MRAAALRRGDLDGAVDPVRAALDQALAAEREELAGEDDDDARFAEMELDNLPRRRAGAVRGARRLRVALTDEARALYEQILEMLRREVLGRASSPG